jgi:quinol monooxygenase YgiN
MRFTQIIEFTTDRIHDFEAAYDDVIASTASGRIPHRAVLHQDRDSNNRYVLVLEFLSHDLAMQNSSRPEVGRFAERLFAICDAPPTFRNLDVLRDEQL